MMGNRFFHLINNSKDTVFFSIRYNSQQLLPKVGEKGRVAAFEIMVANPAIRNLIREEKIHQIDSSIQTGGKYGMQTMDNSLLELYNKGIISKDTLLSQAINRDIIKRYIL